MAGALRRGEGVSGAPCPADLPREAWPVSSHPCEGKGEYLLLNEPRAQTLAALAMASPRRPSAATVGRVLDNTVQAPIRELPAPPQIPAPTFPRRVEIYASPLPPALALPVGVDGAGRLMHLPLRSLGNVLVAGLPGSGKTELVGAMLAGLLRQDPSGQRVSVAVIDPKRADFSRVPRDLAALAYPVARDVDAATRTMAALRDECERRFESLENHGARNIEELHRSGEYTPYLVAFVDEWAVFAGEGEFNAHALYLARMERVAGVCLVLATQRPSARVVSPEIRAMAGAAIAFRMRTIADSRVILDAPGAEALPPVPGRCLVAKGGVVECQAYATQHERSLTDWPDGSISWASSPSLFQMYALVQNELFPLLGGAPGVHVDISAGG